MTNPESTQADPTIIGYEVCEFFGTGDAYFGGSADDRPLGKSGQFLRGCYSLSDIARFATREEADAAGRAAPQRKGSLVSAIPVRDYSLVDR